jgi:hypothetical protein
LSDNDLNRTKIFHLKTFLSDSGCRALKASCGWRAYRRAGAGNDIVEFRWNDIVEFRWILGQKFDDLPLRQNRILHFGILDVPGKIFRHPSTASSDSAASGT